MVGHRFSFEWLSERGLCAWRLSLGVLGPHSPDSGHMRSRTASPSWGVPAQLQTPFLGFTSRQAQRPLLPLVLPTPSLHGVNATCHRDGR